MRLAWVAFVIELMILSILKLIALDIEVAVVILIGINSIFVAINLYKFNNKYKILFYFAYFIRLFAMFWDIYARDIFIFPNSGLDTEGFLRSAIMVSKDFKLITQNIYGGLYSKLLGSVFYITAPERMIGQYINVLIGMSIIVLIYKIFNLIGVKEKIAFIIMVLISIFPNSIIFSAILLRENLITFFVLISFYYFIKWYYVGSIFSMLMSLCYILLGAALHAGVISIGIGYMFTYMFYKHKEKRMKFNRKTLIYFSLFLILFGIIYTNYTNVFLAKLINNIDEVEDIYRVASNTQGGSSYLNSMVIDTPFKLIVYSPIKMLYFLSSPLPTDWRGTKDMFAFFIDSILYLYVTIFTIRKRRLAKDNPLIFSTMLVVLSMVFVFGVGISNAGTAMRHRHKILPVILILFGLLKNEYLIKSREKYFNNENLDNRIKSKNIS